MTPPPPTHTKVFKPNVFERSFNVHVLLAIPISVYAAHCKVLLEA